MTDKNNSCDLTNRLREIPLGLVLRQLGAQQDRLDKAKWHSKQGPISVTGPRFFNWATQAGGGGAIDLVMHLEARGYRDAVQWLGDRFGMAAPNPATSRTVARKRPSANLCLPTRDDRKLRQVTRYLIHERALTPSLVERLIASRTLYADQRANAVFLLLGKEKEPVGAELRGTSGISWRGMAKGSRKEHGYFSVGVPQAKTIVLCEAAIDAISCSILIDDCLCISTAGARPNPAWLPSLLRIGNTIHCGFDADATGDQMADAMMALHPTIRRLRPAQHDWNDMLKATRR